MNTKQRQPIAWKTLLLPNNEKIVISFGYEENEAMSLYDSNHNIFRLDAQGEVVWQVQRDEQGKLNWDALHEHGRSRGEDGWREPFMSFGLVHADGRVESGDMLEWKPGCVVNVSSISGQDYQLDVDKGIITNITPHRQRPW
jgi:hypothetical protein